MKSAVFVQIRVGSHRLPGKALMSWGSHRVTDQVLASLKAIPADIHAVLTDSFSSSSLKPLADDAGFHLFSGPADDVLKRYVMAADYFQPDVIVRATGDNPFVSADLASKLLKLWDGDDYLAFDGPPIGTGVEILKPDALRIACEESFDTYDHEHVAPFLYKNPHRFKVRRLLAPEETIAPDLRVTMDTEEDYRALTELWRQVSPGDVPGPVETPELIRIFTAAGASR